MKTLKSCRGVAFFLKSNERTNKTLNRVERTFEANMIAQITGRLYSPKHRIGLDLVPCSSKLCLNIFLQI